MAVGMTGGSGARLAHVFAIERPKQQTAYPRVRMLILNPVARFRLKDPVVEALKGFLSGDS